MTKTLTAALALALAAGAGGAMAQERPNWSGAYVGVYGGWNQANDQDDEVLRFDRNLDGQFNEQVTLADTGADAFSPGFCGGRARGSSAPQGCEGDGNGGVEAGIRAGYDWQFGNFVVGGLGEFSATNVKDAVTGFSTTPANYTFTRRLDNLAAARLRAGYAVGPALIYGTGGYAWGKIDNRFETSNTANSFIVQEDDDRADGWQAGGGVEYALAPNLTVGGEYLYTSLDAGEYVVRAGNTGTTPATNPFILAPNTAGTDIIRSNSRMGVHAVKIGMNYRF
ncbi:porin family protein [Brevundimonas sp. S30B]|uniref:outer membrane protein n=1 Tax=unclassified Brevundimonas TaxID=2622653 RepID=UPI001072A012|nr:MULTISPECIES: outer membrane beta-barrel protein [unclassified Brevundimonas]QBX37149.1 porin family protein [Brevundimonas sp. MF30-B]TFW04056.1 porin family protein [Brevundimonas sp. S30B]